MHFKDIKEYRGMFLLIIHKNRKLTQKPVSNSIKWVYNIVRSITNLSFYRQ